MEDTFVDASEVPYLEMEKPVNVTTGKGMVLHPQAREIIYIVYCFILVIQSFLPKRFSGKINRITELATGVATKQFKRS